MEAEKYQNISLKIAPLLNALSHPARVQILLHLAKFKGCHAGIISTNLPLAKSTVSGHLSKLREAGLIKSLTDGNSVYYALDDEKFEFVKDLFSNLSSAIDHAQDNRKECCPAC